MVISLVYHIFFGMNIQDYQHMSIGVAEHTYQEDVCIYIYIHVLCIIIQVFAPWEGLSRQA